MTKIAVFDVHCVPTSKIEMLTLLFLNSFQAVTLHLM